MGAVHWATFREANRSPLNQPKPMPIRHCIVHLIDKKPDGTPAVLHARDSELAESAAIENMLADLNESYNAKQGKAWGYFHAESGAHPFSGWLKDYFEGGQDFTAFQPHRRRASAEADGRIQPLHRWSCAVCPLPARHDRPLAILAAPQRRRGGDRAGRDLATWTWASCTWRRASTSPEWQNNKQSKQYISFIKGKNGKKVSEYFRDFIGCQEGVDGPGETRTLLKAFSDFVESEDLPDESARETKTLVDCASSQADSANPWAWRTVELDR